VKGGRGGRRFRGQLDSTGNSSEEMVHGAVSVKRGISLLWKTGSGRVEAVGKRFDRRREDEGTEKEKRWSQHRKGGRSSATLTSVRSRRRKMDSKISLLRRDEGRHLYAHHGRAPLERVEGKKEREDDDVPIIPSLILTSSCSHLSFKAFIVVPVVSSCSFELSHPEIYVSCVGGTEKSRLLVSISLGRSEREVSHPRGRTRRRIRERRTKPRRERSKRSIERSRGGGVEVESVGWG